MAGTCTSMSLLKSITWCFKAEHVRFLPREEPRPRRVPVVQGAVAVGKAALVQLQPDPDLTARPLGQQSGQPPII